MKNQNSISELRENFVSLTYRCPKGAYAPRCPFAVLNGLSDNSRRSIFDRMSRDEMVELFNLVPHCVCPVDPRSSEVRGSSAAVGCDSGPSVTFTR